MPSLHRADFGAGWFVLLRVQDTILPVRLTTPVVIRIGSVVAFKPPTEVWQHAPIRARTIDELAIPGEVVTPELSPTGVAAAEAAPLLAGGPLSAALLRKLLGVAGRAP